jgi:transitional endoplasmic reticulum ATPase
MEILKIHTRKLRMSRDVDLGTIALRTQGFVGADLAQVCTEAAMHCIRDNTRSMNVETDKPIDEGVLRRIEVTKDHFERALRTSKPANLREEMVEIPNVSWEDVGGLEEVKRKMIEMIQLPLENPALFEDFGLNPPKGVLFYGPPGCGKTLIAKAVATQCNANFISVKGPELLTKWFGESESNVRELFEKARQASPCILFFDEIDSIAKSRGSGFGGDSASSASDRVINQILTEMDGISGTKQVFVIGATNRPETIDGALLRPGRLDQLIYIPLPDEKSRMSILRTGLKKVPLDPKLVKEGLLETLSLMTAGYSGADLVELCQRATRYALRDVLHKKREDRVVLWENFQTALSEVRKSVSPNDIHKYEQFEKSMQ